MYPGLEVRAEAPSAWAKELVGVAPVKEEPFLAEKVR
jgi:hypothetical protein